MIKQGVQEIGCYSNNDNIVYQACQSKKHHKKKFLEKCHEMNSKHKIQWHQLFLIFLKQFSLRIIWFGFFNYWLNKGQLRKARRYCSRNIVIQLTTIKMRTTVWKITDKILDNKLYLKNSDRLYQICQCFHQSYLWLEHYLNIGL